MKPYIYFTFILNMVYYDSWQSYYQLSKELSSPTKQHSVKPGSQTLPCVSHKGHPKPTSSIPWVCSGWIFLGFLAFFTLTGFTSFGGLSPCILQYPVHGTALFLHGVPLPVTPSHKGVGSEHGWSPVIIALKALNSASIASILLEKGRWRELLRWGERWSTNLASLPNQVYRSQFHGTWSLILYYR